MATSPSLSTTTRISAWLAQLMPSSDFEFQKSRKRKRAASEPPAIPTCIPTPRHSPTSTLAISMSTERSQSPSKRARTDEEVLPGQSLSVRSHPLALSEHSTFNPPASRASKNRSSASPSRKSEANLRFADPPIRTEPLNGATDPIPRRVMDIMDRLQPDNVERWVPASLKESIMGDSELGVQQISKRAWDPYDTDPSVHKHTLEAVKNIFLCARHCTENGRDENAWCAEVIRPLLELALSLSNTKDFIVQSVQSQTINPVYLSAQAHSSSSSEPTFKPRLVRKADFTLSYSDKTPTFRTLYTGLREHNCLEVSHMTDAYTERTPLFTAIEVKPSNGKKSEAQYQLSVWLAASLRKKAELARAAGFLDTTNLVEPAFVVVGHEWSFYLGYLLSDGSGGAHILEQGICKTDSISGIFQLLRVLTGVVEYGLEREGDGFWCSFFGAVLEKLAGLRG